MAKEIIGAKIKVVGVGGGGGNMVNHMIREGVSGIEMITINTDAQALDKSLANTKLQLGDGLGAGMKPEVGAKAAEKSFDEIKEILDGADMVFVATGLGGGTGTGAAPIVAKAAKEVGALTIAIVTLPFSFEGRKRDRLAQKGMEELKAECDSMVVIQNEKLRSVVDKTLGIRDSFKLVDDVLSRAVGGMSSVVLSCGESDINADFADIKTIMEHKGKAILSIGEGVGDEAAVDAVKDAIESPLLDNLTINGAMGVLIHFTINPNFPLTQIQSAMDIIYDSVHEDADIIFGTAANENLAENEVKITLVATGFESGQIPKLEVPVNTTKKTDVKSQPATRPYDDIKPIPTKPSTSSELINGLFGNNSLEMKKTADGIYKVDKNANLDLPPFMRNQMD